MENTKQYMPNPQLVKLYNADGVEIPKFRGIIDSGKVIINEENQEVHEEPFAIVTEEYTITTHESMLQLIDDVVAGMPEYGTPTKSIETFDRGGKMKAEIIFPEVEVMVAGDILHPRISAFNSYDTYWKRRIEEGAFRVVCTNGLMIGEKNFEYSAKHTSEMDAKQLKFLITGAMEAFSDRTELWKTWVNKVIGEQEQEQILKRVAPFTKTDINLINQEVEISTGAMAQQHQTLTLWIFYNILCQYISHRITSHLKKVKVEASMRNVFRNM